MSRFTAIRERLLSPVGMHAVGVAVLAIAAIVLGIRVGLDWRETSGSNMDAVAGRRAELATLQLQTAPLRGLDKKVALSREQIDEFYAKRIPSSYSAILERLGQLQSKGQVKLSRVAYTPAPGAGDLTEVRMDAGLSGDYPSIMHFVNGLERNPTFFVIRAMNLSGQQSGAVNLRLQVSTWMRPADAAALPVEAKPSTAAPTGQGDAGSGEAQ
jgi:type IV pilus assembly protein PilO